MIREFKLWMARNRVCSLRSALYMNGKRKAQLEHALRENEYAVGQLSTYPILPGRAVRMIVCRGCMAEDESLVFHGSVMRVDDRTVLCSMSDGRNHRVHINMFTVDKHDNALEYRY